VSCSEVPSGLPYFLVCISYWVKEVDNFVISTISYGNVTTAGKELQISVYVRHFWPLREKRSLHRHTCYGTGSRFLPTRKGTKNRPISRFLPQSRGNFNCCGRYSKRLLKMTALLHAYTLEVHLVELCMLGYLDSVICSL
jgi:hypothetical protein